MKSINEKAVELGYLKTWTAAIEVAGVVELLGGDKDFTVFAPTDQAFTELERETIEDLLQNRERLAATIHYHILEGKITTRELPQGAFLRTLFRDELIVNVASSLSINHASIIHPNIECRNGVIHIIDKVLVVNKPSQTRRLAIKSDRSAA